MKNPSAARGSDAGGSKTGRLDTSAQEEQPPPVDMSTVDDGLEMLGYYERRFGELLVGLGGMPLPGR